MSLGVKKQFPEFNLNEYTDEKDLSVDEVTIELKQFDWATESLKSSKIIEEHPEPSIWLRNQLDDTLSICFAETDKFALYYSANKIFKRSSTTIVNGFEQVVELLKLFNNGERALLLSRLKASEYHHKTHWLLDFFGLFIPKEKTKNSREVINEEYLYEVKYSTIFKKLLFSFFYLLLPLAIWGYLYVVDGKPFNWDAYLPLQGILFLLTIPAIIITINHLQQNGNWKLYFRKGENIFFIVTPTGKEMFDKSDFVKRIRIENNSNAPWNSFEYTTLISTSGRQIHFSNLLISSTDLDKLFGRIEEETKKKFLQIIKDN